MIEVKNVSKSYDSIEALRNASYKIAKGEIVGLLGPNGAGKTTMIKILTGYLQPDEGDATIDGIDVLEKPQEVQARIGYLPESAPLYPELSVQSYLQMMADLRQIPETEKADRMRDAIQATGLQDYIVRPIGQLSKGLRQRVGLAQAILHHPPILILDEPTIGLDPTQMVEVRSLIRRLSKESTILFSTHILSEVEALCDRVIILINGEIRADARLSELAATSNVVLVLDKRVKGAQESLRGLANVQDLEVTRNQDGHTQYYIHSQSGKEAADLCPAIFQLARHEDWPLRELRPDRQTLETVFNELATTG
ncbi:MAG: ATP-binding cassette domain-containing protein [Anaerolineales bacterium]|jgi:ABC-2 type transport system ATP-binding protein